MARLIIGFVFTNGSALANRLSSMGFLQTIVTLTMRCSERLRVD
jgi:Fe2+ transport system protein FeoA